MNNWTVGTLVEDFPTCPHCGHPDYHPIEEREYHGATWTAVCDKCGKCYAVEVTSRYVTAPVLPTEDYDAES